MPNPRGTVTGSREVALDEVCSLRQVMGIVANMHLIITQKEGASRFTVISPEVVVMEGGNIPRDIAMEEAAEENHLI